MTTDEKRSPAPSEDIDLLLLLERLISFLKKFRWLFIIAVLCGVLSGILMYRVIPKTYRSRMVVHSFFLTNPEQLQIVDNWNRLLNEKDFKSLAETFNCSEQTLYGVKQIKGKEIQQVFTPNNPNGFTLDVLVTDNNNLDSLQKGIVYGFENNEYIKEKLAAKRSILEELITKTGYEIRKLDSTKKLMENIIGGSGHSSASLIVDGSSINRQLIEMNEKYLGYKESLQFTRAVEVLQSFSKFNRPDGPKLIPWLIIGLFFFLCLAWAYSVFSNISQKLKKRRELSNN
jgi:hypothetical protein